MTDQIRCALPVRQQGASAIGVLLVVTLVVSVVTLLLRLGPHYLDWQAMQSIVEDLPVGEVHAMDVADIRESLRRRFKVNSLRDFDLQKIIIIDRTKEGTSLTIDYERREHLVANIDVVLTFYEQYRYQ